MPHQEGLPHPDPIPRLRNSTGIIATKKHRGHKRPLESFVLFCGYFLCKFCARLLVYTRYEAHCHNRVRCDEHGKTRHWILKISSASSSSIGHEFFDSCSRLFAIWTW